MPKAIIVAKIKFQKAGTTKGFRDFLKYLQYRDGSVRRDAFKQATSEQRLARQAYPENLGDYVKPDGREAKWVDRGLGESYQTIANRCHDWQGRKVMARKWVISPDPELMGYIPEQHRFEVMSRVVESTLNTFYGENSWGQPEYAYVVHDKHLDNKPDNLRMIHAHVITPGTIPVDEAGSMGRMDHFINRHHIQDLHRTAARAFEKEMELMLGPDVAQEIVRQRNLRIAEEQRQKWMEEHGIQPRKREESGLRMDKLARAHDAVALIRREQQRKKLAKEGKKQQRTARMRAEDLRFYARYRIDERRKVQERALERARLARQQERLEREQEHQEGLQQAREEQAQRAEQIVEKGRPIPTYRERQARKAEERRTNMAFWVATDPQFGFGNTQEDFERLAAQIGDPAVMAEYRAFQRFQKRAAERDSLYHNTSHRGKDYPPSAKDQLRQGRDQAPRGPEVDLPED